MKYKECNMFYAVNFTLICLLIAANWQRCSAANEPHHFTERHQAFECIRHYTDVSLHEETKWHILEKIFDFLDRGKMNREQAWVFLVQLFVPLSQRQRGEVIQGYCGRTLVEKKHATLDFCLDKMFRDKSGIVAQKLKSPLLFLLPMYAETAKMFEMLIVDGSQALAERLFQHILQGKLEIDFVYEVVLAHPFWQLRKIIENYEKFKKELDKKYVNDPQYNSFVKERTRHRNQEATSLLEIHLKMKGSAETDQKIKDALEQVILPRLRTARLHQDIFDDEELCLRKYTEGIKALCKVNAINTSQTVNDDQFTKLFREMTNALIKFDYKSPEALKFATLFEEHCLDDLQAVMKENAVIKKETAQNRTGIMAYLRRQPKVPQNSGNTDKMSFYEKLKQKKSVYTQSIKMLIISGLAGAKHQHHYSAFRLKTIHDNGDVQGAITFLTIHLGRDMSSILRHYDKGSHGNEIQAINHDTTMTVTRALSPTFHMTKFTNKMFDLTYIRILSQVWQDGRYDGDGDVQQQQIQCYANMEREWNAELELVRLEMEQLDLEKLKILTWFIVKELGYGLDEHARRNKIEHVRAIMTDELRDYNLIFLYEYFYQKKMAQIQDDYCREILHDKYLVQGAYYSRIVKSDEFRNFSDRGICLLHTIKAESEKFCAKFNKNLNKFRVNLETNFSRLQTRRDWPTFEKWLENMELRMRKLEMECGLLMDLIYYRKEHETTKHFITHYNNAYVQSGIGGVTKRVGAHTGFVDPRTVENKEGWLSTAWKPLSFGTSAVATSKASSSSGKTSNSRVTFSGMKEGISKRLGGLLSGKNTNTTKQTVKAADPSVELKTIEAKDEASSSGTKIDDLVGYLPPVSLQRKDKEIARPSVSVNDHVEIHDTSSSSSKSAEEENKPLAVAASIAADFNKNEGSSISEESVSSNAKSTVTFKGIENKEEIEHGLPVALKNVESTSIVKHDKKGSSSSSSSSKSGEEEKRNLDDSLTMAASMAAAKLHKNMESKSTSNVETRTETRVLTQIREVIEHQEKSHDGHKIVEEKDKNINEAQKLEESVASNIVGSSSSQSSTNLKPPIPKIYTRTKTMESDLFSIDLSNPGTPRNSDVEKNKEIKNKSASDEKKKKSSSSSSSSSSEESKKKKAQKNKSNSDEDKAKETEAASSSYLGMAGNFVTGIKSVAGSVASSVSGILSGRNSKQPTPAGTPSKTPPGTPKNAQTESTEHLLSKVSKKLEEHGKAPTSKVSHVEEKATKSPPASGTSTPTKLLEMAGSLLGWKSQTAGESEAAVENQKLVVPKEIAENVQENIVPNLEIPKNIDENVDTMSAQAEKKIVNESEPSTSHFSMAIAHPVNIFYSPKSKRFVVDLKNGSAVSVLQILFLNQTGVEEQIPKEDLIAICEAFRSKYPNIYGGFVNKQPIDLRLGEIEQQCDIITQTTIALNEFTYSPSQKYVFKLGDRQIPVLEYLRYIRLVNTFRPQKAQEVFKAFCDEFHERYEQEVGNLAAGTHIQQSRDKMAKKQQIQKRKQAFGEIEEFCANYQMDQIEFSFKALDRLNHILYNFQWIHADVHKQLPLEAQIAHDEKCNGYMYELLREERQHIFKSIEKADHDGLHCMEIAKKILVQKWAAPFCAETGKIVTVSGRKERGKPEFYDWILRTLPNSTEIQRRKREEMLKTLEVKCAEMKMYTLGMHWCPRDEKYELHDGFDASHGLDWLLKMMAQLEPYTKLSAMEGALTLNEDANNECNKFISTVKKLSTAKTGELSKFLEYTKRSSPNLPIPICLKLLTSELTKEMHEICDGAKKLEKFERIVYPQKMHSPEFAKRKTTMENLLSGCDKFDHEKVIQVPMPAANEAREKAIFNLLEYSNNIWHSAYRELQSKPPPYKCHKRINVNKLKEIMNGQRNTGYGPTILDGNKDPACLLVYCIRLETIAAKLAKQWAVDSLLGGDLMENKKCGPFLHEKYDSQKRRLNWRAIITMHAQDFGKLKISSTVNRELENSTLLEVNQRSPANREEPVFVERITSQTVKTILLDKNRRKIKEEKSKETFNIEQFSLPKSKVPKHLNNLRAGTAMVRRRKRSIFKSSEKSGASEKLEEHPTDKLPENEENMENLTGNDKEKYGENSENENNENNEKENSKIATKIQGNQPISNSDESKTNEPIDKETIRKWVREEISGSSETENMNEEQLKNTTQNPLEIQENSPDSKCFDVTKCQSHEKSNFWWCQLAHAWNANDFVQKLETLMNGIECMRYDEVCATEEQKEEAWQQIEQFYQNVISESHFSLEEETFISIDNVKAPECLDLLMEQFVRRQMAICQIFVEKSHNVTNSTVEISGDDDVSMEQNEASKICNNLLGV